MSKNKKLSIVLIVVLALMIIVPLVAFKGAEFVGSDDSGSQMIAEIQGEEAEPWATPVFEMVLGGELPGEIETLFFCLQTGLGAGVLGFFFGRFYERKKSSPEPEQES